MAMVVTMLVVVHRSEAADLQAQDAENNTCFVDADIEASCMAFRVAWMQACVIEQQNLWIAYSR